MIYSIELSARVAQWFCGGALLLCLIFQEVKVFNSYISLQRGPIHGRNGFIPPDGDGFEHYVNRDTIVFLHPLCRGEWRAYISRGNPPAAAATKADKNGTYFLVRAESAARAEAIVDQIYSH